MHLIITIFLQIYIWQLKDDDLVGVAFIDTQIYIHQIITIKNMILAADVFKSISLLRFQEEYRTLSLVSKVSDKMDGPIPTIFFPNFILLYLICFPLAGFQSM